MRFSLHDRGSKLLPVLILIILFCSSVNGQLTPENRIRILTKEYSHTTNDSLKIEKLSEIAFICEDMLYDSHRADSVAEIAINIARESHRNDLQLLAYNRYIEVIELDFNQEKNFDYAVKALELSSLNFNALTGWRVLRNLANVYLAEYHYEKALTTGNSALKLAQSLKNEKLKAESYLLIGNSYEGRNQRIEAFTCYMEAMNIAESLDDFSLRRECYSILSNFYKNNRLFTQSIKYKNLEEIMILRTFPIDFTALMYAQYDLLLIDMEMNQNRMDLVTARNIMGYAHRAHDKRLQVFIMALVRQHFIEAGQIKKLYDLYHFQYPEEMDELRGEDLPLYYRLQAYFHEELNHHDSANYYMQKAESLLRPITNKILKSNFYHRWGQFYLRQGRQADALRKFKLAYSLADSASYYSYMLNASSQIEAIYRDMGNYGKAYQYSSLNRVLSDSINNAARKEQVIMGEINRQTQLWKAASKREKENAERAAVQRRLERNITAGGVGVLMILFFFIFRSYRLQKKFNRNLDKEKKRSDELLLNILPVETADELKKTGTAKAKRFELVTVMFTDFKNFTHASENMSAEALVEEVHAYFSGFDQIISRHNIEKIKIIGDSYMCAGGLPVENHSHAYDVVSAALELQKFVEAQKKLRISQGRIYFELRIGINTGPVVAGIVGLKKFAYDIWGDTVNTASRMEECGEVSKVNISGNTFLHVSDRFQCTYRGKIQAKNKGEIDMYFVEHR
ncbi:MAG TPA: adenylate/guanylate cyclase domain-containing protein [Bacteroidales bacterium]|nr:adenylate/guanylate cyclase domain-containing protein [Bacteroidales bacterium]HPS73747.1 adenylate/guanylate cyclase domain-containing protein [Bacteroidales bacterium]